MNRGEALVGRIFSDEAMEKMSKAHMGHPVTEETRKKISEGNKRAWLMRKKMGVWLGASYSPSEETRKKISEALKGRTSYPPSEETRKKISEALKGRTRSGG